MTTLMIALLTILIALIPWAMICHHIGRTYTEN